MEREPIGIFQEARSYHFWLKCQMHLANYFGFQHWIFCRQPRKSRKLHISIFCCYVKYFQSKYENIWFFRHSQILSHLLSRRADLNNFILFCIERKLIFSLCTLAILLSKCLTFWSITYSSSSVRRDGV
jgi:hypothetical protein